jgi:hypothetical protein
LFYDYFASLWSVKKVREWDQYYTNWNNVYSISSSLNLLKNRIYTFSNNRLSYDEITYPLPINNTDYNSYKITWKDNKLYISFVNNITKTTFSYTFDWSSWIYFPNIYFIDSENSIDNYGIDTWKSDYYVGFNWFDLIKKYFISENFIAYYYNKALIDSIYINKIVKDIGTFLYDKDRDMTGMNTTSTTNKKTYTFTLTEEDINNITNWNYTSSSWAIIFWKLINSNSLPDFVSKVESTAIKIKNYFILP